MYNDCTLKQLISTIVAFKPQIKHCLNLNSHFPPNSKQFLVTKTGSGGGRGPDPIFLLLCLWDSCILLSFHIYIPHPMPNFGESHFPGAVKSQIPRCFLVKSGIRRKNSSRPCEKYTELKLKFWHSVYKRKLGLKISTRPLVGRQMNPMYCGQQLTMH